MKLDPGTFCPLIKDNCIQLKCKFFIKLRGNDPQTGDPIDEYDCAISWIPVLLIENTSKAIQNGASIDSFRNEMIRLSAPGAVIQSHSELLKIQQGDYVK
jgi:hypothetical protein